MAVFVNFEFFVVFGMKYNDKDNSEKVRKDEMARKSFGMFRVFRCSYIDANKRKIVRDKQPLLIIN